MNTWIGHREHPNRHREPEGFRLLASHDADVTDDRAASESLVEQARSGARGAAGRAMGTSRERNGDGEIVQSLGLGRSAEVKDGSSRRF